ncbi:MAG: prolyl oligopeptidase family serine peptidase [Vicinamibacteraceae bacterium]
MVHGGPGGQSRTGYSAMVQHLVNHGYAVLAANNRGFSGYGKRFYHMDDKRHGDLDLKDILAGKTWLAAQPWVDAERIGIIGGSYGGYMVGAALAFEPTVFDVGINMFGVMNWVWTLENIPPWWQAQKQALFDEMGDPATDGERHRRISLHDGTVVLFAVTSTKRRPVHDDGHSAGWVRRWSIERVDEEPAVARNVVGKSACRQTDVEQRHGQAHAQCRCGPDRDGHQSPVRRHVVQLRPIPPPARLVAAVGRDANVDGTHGRHTIRGEIAQVNLAVAGFVGAVSDPSPVRGERCRPLVGIGDQQRHRLPAVHTQDIQIRSSSRMELVEDQIAAIG